EILTHFENRTSADSVQSGNLTYTNPVPSGYCAQRISPLHSMVSRCSCLRYLSKQLLGNQDVLLKQLTFFEIIYTFRVKSKPLVSHLIMKMRTGTATCTTALPNDITSLKFITYIGYLL